MPVFRFASATDTGRTRPTNQDAMFADESLLIVADGMGGHAGGEVASQSAVTELEEAFREHPTGKGLLAGTKTANREVFTRSESEEQLRGMGTTLVAAALVPGRGGHKIALMNVGDSRAYLLKGRTLEQLTEDHSLVEEMLRQGEISEDAARVHPYRHVLTRAVGINERVEIDSWTLTPEVGTRLLLCSDGLTNECSDDVITEILIENEDPADAASALIRRALDHGGTDNITAIVADIVASELESVATVVPDAKRPRERHAERTDQNASGAHRVRPPVPRALVDQLVTFRVVLFSFTLVLILAGSIGFGVWFDKATYYVGIDNNSVAIFNGRPGGLLWFQPQVVLKSSLSLTQVLPANVALLRSGMLEPSYDDALQAVADLKHERPLVIGNATNSGSKHG